MPRSTRRTPAVGSPAHSLSVTEAKKSYSEWGGPCCFVNIGLEDAVVPLGHEVVWRVLPGEAAPHVGSHAQTHSGQNICPIALATTHGAGAEQWVATSLGRQQALYVQDLVSTFMGAVVTKGLLRELTSCCGVSSQATASGLAQ